MPVILLHYPGNMATAHSAGDASVTLKQRLEGTLIERIRVSGRHLESGHLRWVDAPGTPLRVPIATTPHRLAGGVVPGCRAPAMGDAGR